jgi:hypothetical protein
MTPVMDGWKGVFQDSCDHSFHQDVQMSDTHTLSLHTMWWLTDSVNIHTHTHTRARARTTHTLTRAISPSPSPEP